MLYPIVKWIHILSVVVSLGANLTYFPWFMRVPKNRETLVFTIGTIRILDNWIANPFSIANAFSEEAIFRIGIVSPLYGIFSVSVIVLISGLVFGAPHYFGMPSGVVGALMAGFLGWLLAMSLVETQGLLIAWAIHFVQDVVITPSMILMSKKRAL